MNVKTSRSFFFSMLLFFHFSIYHLQNLGRFDPFEILEVSPGASAAEVKKANLPVFLETLLDF